MNMKIGEFKDYALRTMTEEHLWKRGESDTFEIMGITYKIEMNDNGCFVLSVGNKETNFATMGRLFGYLLRTFKIYY